MLGVYFDKKIQVWGTFRYFTISQMQKDLMTKYTNDFDCVMVAIKIIKYYDWYELLYNMVPPKKWGIPIKKIYK